MTNEKNPNILIYLLWVLVIILILIDPVGTKVWILFGIFLTIVFLIAGYIVGAILFLFFIKFIKFLLEILGLTEYIQYVDFVLSIPDLLINFI